MTTTRKCRHVPLSKQPLILVLCQVRFSPVRKMADYLPSIQEEFRRHGFPIERAGKIQQLTITPAGVHATEQERWDYRTRDETWSVTILQDSVVLQTTAYERFEGFAERLERAVKTVLDKTEQDKFGVIQRIGLRYVDLVQPRTGEDYRTYLRPGFHGVADEVFRPRSHRLHVESVGRTAVGDDEGTMIVRVVQNDQGSDLPPDLVGGAPKHDSRARAGELVTLVDMDHFIEGKFEPDAGWVVARAYEMHDHLIETFHNHVVTDKAIEVWR
jgi:uncharacterized protein (TIGR04255 family)